MDLPRGNQTNTSARIPWVRALLVATTLLAAATVRADLPPPKPPLPSQSNPPSLVQPADCIIGQTCYIQNYVDADPGPAARDFRCNPLSYDGHKGTDFAIPTLADMARGVAVLAAAPGRVRGVRDGMEDGAYLNDPNSVKEVECGNGLAIEHGHGWETQYCHLRKGSLLVKPGQEVTSGTPLGLIGQSGLAEFPHVHFALRFQGKPVDPYNPDRRDACAQPPEQTLWTGTPPAYIPGGVLLAGFAQRSPKLDVIGAGGGAAETLPPDSPQISLWGYLFGVRAGDEVVIEFAGPDNIYHKRTNKIDRNIAILSRFSAKRRAGPAWPTGAYTGRVTLMRNGQSLDYKTATTFISP